MTADQQKIRVLNKLVEHYGHQNWWEDDNRLKDCVSMILIQQSTQQNVEKALLNLAPYFSLQQLEQLDIGTLETLIRPSGFFKQKAQYIKNLVAFFLAHGADLDAFEQFSTAELRQKLLAVKGVGSETADVMLLYIFNRKVFIADNYAMRLFQRLGWGEYKNYEAMKKAVNHLVDEISLKQCKEWHACIDVHGKTFRLNAGLDESFLRR